MIRSGFIIFPLWVCTLSAAGQLARLPVASPGADAAVAQSGEEPAPPLTLPFWDDFSRSRGLPDPCLWATGEDLFVNNHLGVDPPTLNVATFDGVDRTGAAYDEVSQHSGPGDILTSQPIDLTAVPLGKKSSVYLSFFWQIRGNGEIPDSSDSLQLQFLDASQIWVSQDLLAQDDALALPGGTQSLRFDPETGRQVFSQIILPVSQQRYFHEEFQFRFQSFSSLTGIFDNWHLDYIYMNYARHAGDVHHIDRSMSAKPTALFSPYREIPHKQLLAGIGDYLTRQNAYVSNLDSKVHPLEYRHTLVNLSTNSQISSGYILGPRLEAGEIGRQIGGISMEGLEIGSEGPLEILSQFVLKSGDKNLFEEIGPQNDTLFLPVNLRVNDTITYVHRVDKKLAYDDGTGEFAAGINLNKGMVACKFELKRKDVVTEIHINFPTVRPSSAGKNILVKIWKDLEGSPPLTSENHIIVRSGINEFQEIVLSSPVEVDGIFYVGFEQFTNNYIGVGLDRHNPIGRDILYTKLSPTWTRNEYIQGVLMIRCVFGEQAPSTLSANRPPAEPAFVSHLSGGMLRANSPFSSMKILDIQGRLRHKSGGLHREVNLSHLPDGIYFMEFVSEGKTYRDRLLISK